MWRLGLQAFGGLGDASIRLQCEVPGSVGICTWAIADSSKARRVSSSCIEVIIRIDAGDLGCSSMA
ncbi:hypothetical protein D3C80_2050860 [compost metagenome]